VRKPPSPEELARRQAEQLARRQERLARREAEAARAEAEAIKDSFVGPCAVCGVHGRFVRRHYAISEGYRCPTCIALVRYQGQARVLLDRYSRHGSTSLRDLVGEPEFRELRIWEPGELGPFRSYFMDHPNSEVSHYWPGVPSGELRDGIRCEDLMALSFASSSLDIVITSDIFEHVRRPLVGFSEVHRVLRPGGTHVFSVPGLWPLRQTTLSLVDVSGDDDVFLEEPRFHGDHLIYNEFGLDLLDRLSEIGFHTDVIRFACDNQSAARVVTFCSTKLDGGGAVAPL
jgi:SAM-dependent methyltransferase